MKPHQWEMPVIGQVFSLVVEQGDDPFRIERERWAEEQRQAEAREFERTMQRKLEECPGFIGADAPRGPEAHGRVVVDPSKIREAMDWLRRRFHVAESLELGQADGLVLEVAPRTRRSGQSKRAVRFGKVEQFTFDL